MTDAWKFRFVRPGWLPTLIMLVGLAVLLGLGFWQLERLAWKQGIIAQISERTSAPPVAAPSYGVAWDASMEYRRVKLSGVYQHDLEVPIYALGPRGLPGYHIFTPLARDGAPADTVLINRGWVPETLLRASTRTAGLVEGVIEVEGLLRMPGRPSEFTPDNRATDNVWFWPDLAAITEARRLELLAVYVVEAAASPDGPAPPYGGATRLQIKNDHLGYAVTWFGLALALIGVFGVYHLRRPQNDG